MNGLLTTVQVAQKLQISSEAVRRLLRDGILQGFKLGSTGNTRHWRIKTEELDRFIQRGQAGVGLTHTESDNDSQGGAKAQPLPG